MNYTTLVGAKTLEGSIKNVVNHSDVPAGVVLKDAESWIYQRLRHQEMRELATGTLALGASTLDVSSLRMIAPIRFSFTGNDKLRVSFRTLEQFENAYAPASDGTPEVGTPRWATHDGNTIRFNVETDAAYLYRMWYYKRPAALSGSNETNFLTDDMSLLLRAATNWLAFMWAQNESMSSHWKSVADNELMTAKIAAEEAMHGFSDVDLELPYQYGG